MMSQLFKDVPTILFIPESVVILSQLQFSHEKSLMSFQQCVGKNLFEKTSFWSNQEFTPKSLFEKTSFWSNQEFTPKSLFEKTSFWSNQGFIAKSFFKKIRLLKKTFKCELVIWQKTHMRSLETASEIWDIIPFNKINLANICWLFEQFFVFWLYVEFGPNHDFSIFQLLVRATK